MPVKNRCSSKRYFRAEIISYLPRHIRQQEAQYHLNSPALITAPYQRLPYAAFLPWEDARAFLDVYICDPDPELRKLALSILVSATRYNRSYASEILNIVKQRRNEQDPIRGAMIGELSALPPSIWHSQHLQDLSQIINDALNAADLSHTTASAAERLVIQILPFHPAWSAQQLAFLVQQRGQVSFYNLAERLSDNDILRIAPSLLPVLQSWQTRERESNIITAARSIGRQRQLLELLSILLTHPDPLVRIDVLERCRDLPVNNSEQILLPTLLQNINSPLFKESSATVYAVFTTYKNSADIINWRHCKKYNIQPSHPVERRAISFIHTVMATATDVTNSARSY